MQIVEQWSVPCTCASIVVVLATASIENQQALTDATCARARDRVEPHGHPVARLFPTSLRSGLGIGPKFCVHHIDMTICYGYICV